MTRHLGQRHPRRLQRMRPALQRPEHGLDLALVALRPEPEPAPAQRADQRALRALAEENALLARELGRVQARCTQWRDDCIAQAERLEALLMRARGDKVAMVTQLAAMRDILAAVRATAPTATPALHGRHVLCVGGRARQVPIYQALVERDGGSFRHMDGAHADCLPELRLALAEADLVILQPGYSCRGVCEAVETHCARSGVRCVRLARPCVNEFAASLEQTTSGD